MIIEKVKDLYLVKSETGLYITPFKDGNDIKKFYASKRIFITNPNKVNVFREITAEEYERYSQEKQIAIKALENENN